MSSAVIGSDGFASQGRRENQADTHTHIHTFIITANSPLPADPEPQRGMDRYLDSLFDPVLSDGNWVS